MSKLNAKKVSREVTARKSSHQNWMSGTSFDINDPFTKLRIVAASSFFGEPKFYSEQSTSDSGMTIDGRKEASVLTKEMYNHLNEHLNAVSPWEWRSLSPKKLIEKCIDECLAVNVERTLQIAVQLRSEDFMRATPQVILVRAAVHPNAKGTGFIRQYAPQICKRGDEPANGLAYFISEYGRGKLPNSLKRAWKEILESFDDYVISKYKMENNQVKTIDVCSLVHAFSPAIDKLFKGKQKQKKTWNAIVSNADNSSKEKKQKNWTKAIEGMPHMALLRNLRNLAENSVDLSLFAEKLKNGVRGGKQLPFRYLSAFNELNKYPKLQDLVEDCLEISVDNIPHFSGRTMCLSDNSGSARGVTTSPLGKMSIAEIGNLMSVLTAKASDEGFVGVFGDKLDVYPIRGKSSVFDCVNKINIAGKYVGESTENGIWLFFDKAIREKEHWDNIFVYSDMQAGHGGLYGVDQTKYKNYCINGRYIDVAMLIQEYRKTVNSKVMVYLVQTAGYADALVPEFYERTFIIGGWSTGILNFAHSMNEVFCGQN